MHFAMNILNAICSQTPSKIHVLFHARLLFFLVLTLPEHIIAQIGGFGYAEQDEYTESFFRQLEINRHNGIYNVLAQSMYNLLPKPSQSVVDVGCGTRMLVEAWRSVANMQSYCIEGSPNAKSMWPDDYAKDYYQLVDLKETEVAMKFLPKTDIVTSFEVAEHLPPSYADSFVQLLVHHKPSVIIFGAATPFQDRGMNPSHVNENTLRYWIEKFQANGYIVDMPRTAQYRHMLATNEIYRRNMSRSLWYLKNVLMLVPASSQPMVDQALLAHPPQANMLHENYLQIGKGAIEELWRRDWTEFGTLFYEEQGRAKARLFGNSFGEQL